MATPSLPSFIYPPNNDTQSSTPNVGILNWNYLDTANVSWTTQNPNSNDDYEVLLTLWWQNGDETEMSLVQNNTVAKSGSREYPLTFGHNYPCFGVFELIYMWPNGTNDTGPNTQWFNVTHDSSLQPQTWTAPKTTNPSSGNGNNVTDFNPPSSSSQSSPSSSLSGGAIAGIVIAAVAVVLAITGIILFLVRRQRRQKQAAYSHLAHQDASAQINSIYATARSPGDHEKGMEKGAGGPNGPTAPHRGRFAELLASVRSPRDQQKAQHGHYQPQMQGARPFEGISEMPNAEGSAAAELPGNGQEVAEMRGMGSPVEMGSERL